MKEVLDTTARVAEKGGSVQIDPEALDSFAKKLADEKISPPEWDTAYHYADGTEATVAYFLVLDTINFCFWQLPGTPRWEIEHEGKTLSGYIALAAALRMAMERGVPLADAGYLSTCTLEEFKEILGGSGDLLLMERRVRNLNELGKILLRKYEGKAHRLVENAGGSAVQLVRVLAGELTSFRDVAAYDGTLVYFYKRAQILAADLYGAFRGMKWGRFRDMDRLTTFADYKVPQVLRHLGILQYAPGLQERVDHRVLLGPGSPEEVEIRANTIWAVELIRRALLSLGKELKAYELDWILWNLGQQEAYRERPYHLTMTMYY
jgi:hypothetical protein